MLYFLEIALWGKCWLNKIWTILIVELVAILIMIYIDYLVKCTIAKSIRTEQIQQATNAWLIVRKA